MRLALRAALLFAPLLLTTGCWSHIEDYCAGCTVVDHLHSDVPAIKPATNTVVFLVHGAFGFGDEWRPIIETVRRSPGFDLVAWSWPGPFRNPPKDATRLADEIQALLENLPPTVDELIVLAHSAGGLITNLAIRQLRVPPHRHVTVALLDPVFFPRLTSKAAYHPLGARISATVFYAANPPRHPKAPQQSEVNATDLPIVYVGPVGHDPMVAKAALPILAARRDGLAHANASSETAPIPAPTSEGAQP